MLHLRTIGVVALMSVLALGGTASATAAASVIDRTCAAVEVIFARGSGQDLAGNEFKTFRDKVHTRIGSVTFTSYELGSETIAGHKYPAVNVSNPWNGNALGGKFGSGLSGDYGDSVWEGVKELISYIYPRSTHCPNTQFVLGGYSQGAQVIGQTYSSLGDVRDQVAFNALFGDPKLYLPEGEGFHLPGSTTIAPPACRGEDLSQWRRTVPNCDVDNGSLGARKPYLPAGRKSNDTGLWCNDHDFVCGSSKWLWDVAGHGQYADEGGGIDEAAIEIAGLLKSRLPAEVRDQLDTSIHAGAGTTGMDVVFVIDSTGSMTDRINAAKSYASTMAGEIADLRGRVALVEYRDAGDAFVARTLTGLTTDVSAFRTQLGTIQAGGGGDIPEALLSALMESFDTLEWRAGATKAAVVLTDADYHDPDLANGWTTAQVAARALAIDPVNVYPVVPAGLEGTYTSLTSLTSGRTIVDTGDTVAALREALTRISTRPVVRLAVDAYRAEPGQLVTFDASKSYDIGSTIVEFAFDFNGDGTFDTVGESPRATHTYTAPFDGTMQVRATALDGGIASMSAPVQITSVAPVATEPAAPAHLRAVVTGTAPDGTDTVTLTWSPSDGLASFWGVALDGVPVGLAEGTRTSAEVTGVVRTKDVEFAVVGLTTDRAKGTESTVVLAARGPGPGWNTDPGPGPAAGPAPTAGATMPGAARWTPPSPDRTSPTSAPPTGASPTPTSTPTIAVADAARVGPSGSDRGSSPIGGIALWGAVGVLAIAGAVVTAARVRRRAAATPEVANGRP